jgi:diketogulonate reductase-like aldo/keto reductase
MEIPVKKLQNGFEIPVFGFGGWKLGGSRERDPGNDDQADIAAVQYAIESGITHFDTAEKYAQGWSEELIGQGIKGYDRTKLFLTSKVDKIHLRQKDLLESLKRTLERLQTHYLDLYLIHAPNPEVPIEETMGAMNEAVRQGLVKHIGVSNFTAEQLKQAQAVTSNKIVCNQVYYNLTFRLPEKDGLLDYCQNNDVILNAWRPVEKGVLAQAGINILDQMSVKYGKTPAQIAINWLVSQTNVITISKMRNKAHIDENLGAIGWTMEKNDIEQLRAEFPHQIFDYNEVSWEAPNSLTKT